MAVKKKSFPAAAKIIEKFGGIRPLARLLECNPSIPWAWAKRSGKVPRWWHERIMALAVKHGVDLYA